MDFDNFTNGTDAPTVREFIVYIVWEIFFVESKGLIKYIII